MLAPSRSPSFPLVHPRLKGAAGTTFDPLSVSAGRSLSPADSPWRHWLDCTEPAPARRLCTGPTFRTPCHACRRLPPSPAKRAFRSAFTKAIAILFSAVNKKNKEFLWTVPVVLLCRPSRCALRRAFVPSLPTRRRSIMILTTSTPVRQGRLAQTLAGTGAKLSRLPFVLLTQAGFLLFRSRPHDPGSAPAFARPLPPAVLRPGHAR